jgi:flagellar basal-body rod protein FlgF
VLRSLQTAEQAMQLQQLRIETFANNLANVNSTAFKQVLTRVAEEGSMGIAWSPGAQADETGTGEDVAGGLGRASAVAPLPSARGRPFEPSGPLLMFGALDSRPGPLRETGNPTDLALVGEGFFVVQTETGESYTRDGSLHLDGEGQLVSDDGHAVLGSGGPLKMSGSVFQVGRDGAVSAAGNEIGKLRVVRFSDPSRLQHVGHGLLTAPPDMVPEDVPAANVLIAQGQLEGSNVNPIDTLVNMIAAQRAFETASRLISNADQSLDQSINKLGQTR